MPPSQFSKLNLTGKRAVPAPLGRSRVALGGKAGAERRPQPPVPTYCVGMTRARALGQEIGSLLRKELRRLASARIRMSVSTYPDERQHVSG